ncbi:MAG TPA: hypothetical protein VL614_05910 [Acetobacteraceae bacterium]|nr:hypothetical protein [Acetobacteraceae bacterium]
MRESASVLAAFILLCASAALGMWVRPRLPEHHRTRETTELMQITIGLLVTFAALVLGLLTASVKERYDDTAQDRQDYALQLTALDRCLADYGPETASARAKIHSYTAAVIASTWPDESPPTGVQYPSTATMPRTGASPVLGETMNRIGTEISRLSPASPAQTRVLDFCVQRYRDVIHARLGVIEDARTRLFEPFYGVLMFWLMIIFGCFGLVAPRTSLSVIVIALCAVSLSSVIFVILDLSRPYQGYFAISSATMRTALDNMLSAAQ